MESDEFVKAPDSSSPQGERKIDGNHSTDCESSKADSLYRKVEMVENMINGNNPVNNEGDAEIEDAHHQITTPVVNDFVANTSILQVSVEIDEHAAAERMNSVSSVVEAKTHCVTVQDASPPGKQKRSKSPVSISDVDGSRTGSKRPRIAVDERQPSVHVMYSSLTRYSKCKLEELLQQWSEWHAQNCSSHDSNAVLESGEGTYFPALNVGLEKSSVVSFWIDPQGKEFIPLDSSFVPLYDRAYSFGLTSTAGSSDLDRGLEIADASRCFNCGSYNHSLKECPKPRDNAAVNSARKQHKSKRNLNSSSRIPTRYYQSTPGGKYDGLRPGSLDAETRKLLGLGELDPPPWLHRMREIGYPPGYIEQEDEDQPSGITVFADDESSEEKEDGEILDMDYPKLPSKMTVEFPGINAPTPENADERRWEASSSSFGLFRNRSYRRQNNSSELASKARYYEPRRSRDFRDDVPLGYDHETSQSISSYYQRYGSYDSRYTSPSPRGNISISGSSSFGRYSSERSRRSSLHESSSHGESYYSSP